MKILRFILLIIASLIFIAVINQYFFCPVYSFDTKTQFSGDSIYNPYANIVSGKWVKCNFHAHARCWDGLTNGSCSATDIHHIYDQLHYSIHTVSNYQYIDTTAQSSPAYISSYEHGYNILKSHQLVLGANTVYWKDYFFPQNPNNKQYILDHLSASDPGGVIMITHPLLRNGYSVSDIAGLTGYSCMEVLNPACNSSTVWDAALSAGKPVFVAGNDDVHDVYDSNSVGRICTWINLPAINKGNIIHAMKTGSAYAMAVGKELMEKERHDGNDCMPMLHSFTMKEDTMLVTFSMKAKQISISGENGHILYKVSDTNTVLFALGNNPYARITATYNDGTQLLLNPVFRYKHNPLFEAAAGINSSQTLLHRTSGTFLLVIWFSPLLLPVFSKRRQKRSLPNFSTSGYGYILNSTAKIIQVRYRRFAWNLRRFFNDMVVERKRKIT